MIPFTKFFPKQFPQKLSGTHDNHPARVFLKNAASPFRQIPASNPNVMQPILKNENEKPALPFILAESSPSGSRSPVQKRLLAHFFKPDSCRIPPNR
jgi:hypothetical protein